MGFWDKTSNILFGGLGKSPDGNASQFQDRNYIAGTAQQGIAGAQGRAAPQATNTQVGQVQTGQASQLDGAQQAQMRQGQQTQINSLMQTALGNQAGAGELAAQRQGQRMIANQQAMAASARGGSGQLAQLGAARNAMDIGGQVAGQAQQAAMADKQQANQLLSGALGQARGQDIGMASENAGLSQQMNMANLSAQNQGIFQQAGLNNATSLANMQAKLAQTGMNDAAIQAYLQQLTGMNSTELQGRMSQETAAMGQTGLAGGLMSSGGAILGAMASDQRVKKNISDGSSTVRAALSHLKPYDYEYTDEKHGVGRRPGIMAQDLEKSAAGRAAVREIDGVKHVDVNRALSLSLAANADLHARVNKLEGK